MKAQMSLEMLAYVALAGISMLYSISAVSEYSTRAGQYLSGYSYSTFVESINTALLQGSSAVSLAVPQGLCNSSVSGEALDTKSGQFFFVEDVEVNRALLCTSGTYEASITYAPRLATIS